ncbi:2-dehydro-3-deoxy-D-gluconate 5-dehydrogenase KduD [Simiduia agarivorans]|uniref:2-deoxy-D-gluconate 3-dehydrogenase n=1 Tax=Simiduia agarivorans (strain DSM 21679 / JCM 13881 / BCRC 17597 / SA1) TaxID=1117647 RepID=K4KI45_SIMAS|nr:2-dehydro-3-deoxy-D-gluconate 5-dehydrogenase KduD [Simiduia agarivorans]AFU98804.1 2-deoxy-D-gluconate 3-dehydrogenase [Simiduia agarivorans SA1 = DSM 21679]
MSNYLKSLFSLNGKVAVVTGASRGLGQGMALALGRAGATVVAVGSQLASVEKTLALLAQEKITAHGFGCDQSDPAAVAALVQAVQSQVGQVDILVNNAGTIRRAPAAEYSDDDWAAVMDTNINGVFRLCREFGRQMLANGSGKIINIASLLSFSGGITVPAYAASKGAVAQLTKALANEWAASGVQVNAIAPGYFETDNTENLRKDSDRFAAISARIPANRWGLPEDLAGAAVFLASPASDYVNGHLLLVDGGWMAR